MTRLLSAAALAVLIAQPALAGGLGFDLPNLPFPKGSVTVSTADCGGPVSRTVCTPEGK